MYGRKKPRKNFLGFFRLPEGNTRFIFCARSDLLFNLCTLTDTVAQVEELCTTNATLANDDNLRNVGRMEREY